MRTPSRPRRRQTPARARAVPGPRPTPTANLYLRAFPRDLADALHLAALDRKTTIGALVTAPARAALARLAAPSTLLPAVPFHLRGIPTDLAHALRIEATRRKVRIADLLAPLLQTWVDAQRPRRRRSRRGRRGH